MVAKMDVHWAGQWAANLALYLVEMKDKQLAETLDYSLVANLALH